MPLDFEEFAIKQTGITSKMSGKLDALNEEVKENELKRRDDNKILNKKLDDINKRLDETNIRVAGIAGTISVIVLLVGFVIQNAIAG